MAPQEFIFDYIALSELPAIATAHAMGTKKVLSKGRNDLTRITQIAWGSLMPGEAVSEHRHPDMDECFYFIRGSGALTVNGQVHPLHEGLYIRIPAMAEHALACTDEKLEFFYFGLQVYS